MDRTPKKPDVSTGELAAKSWRLAAIRSTIETMRVIAGKFRSRSLIAPEGLLTRPTSDRLRESLFNILAPRIAGSIFADLYSGSGAVGVEAISRSAALVFFVESAEPAMATIRANLSALKIISSYGLELRTVSSFLRRFAQKAATTATTLDIVFLDPPWEDHSEYAATLGLLGGECSAALSAESIVIAEHRRRQPLAEQYGALTRTRVKEQGDAALSFYTLALSPEREVVGEPELHE